MATSPTRAGAFISLLSSRAKVEALNQFDIDHGFLSLFGEDAAVKREMLHAALQPITDEAFKDALEEIKIHFLKCECFDFLDTSQQCLLFGSERENYQHLNDLRRATQDAYKALRVIYKSPERHGPQELEEKKQALRDAYRKEDAQTPKLATPNNGFVLPDAEKAIEICIRSAEIMGRYDQAIANFQGRDLS